jgi:hypothetical protein
VRTVGTHTADAILSRAAGWFAALFIRTGVVGASYRLPIPDPHTPGAGMAKLADNPFWPWLAGRLDVVWLEVARHRCLHGAVSPPRAAGAGRAVFGAVLAGLLSFAVANTQKRL